jgi:hypothetical protein
MYHLINRDIQAVLQSFPRNHVPDYDWLQQNLNLCGTQQYQTRYKKYWRLNAARLSPNFCNIYFQALQASKRKCPTARGLAQRLYATPTHRNGRQGLQFSFATKLVHMVDPTTPIYDSLIAGFYFWQEPSRRLSVARRLGEIVRFHAFLADEYRRILRQNLLSASIQKFRNHFNPRHFTDEKVIDSLLWAYVALLRNGGIINGTVIYQ